MALAAGIWGGMYVVSKIVLAQVQPMSLVWLRYMVALVALAVAVLATQQSWRIHWRHLPLVALVGIIGYGVSIWAQFLGTKWATAQMGAMITSATPAFMVLFGRVLLAEHITARKAFSVGLASVGILLVVGVGGLNSSYKLGGVVLVVAALTWGLMSVLVKRIPPEYSQLTVTMYAVLTAAIVITPVAVPQLMRTPLEVLLAPKLWASIVYLGVVSTAGAFFLWNKGLQQMDASSGAVFFFFQPVVGIVLGWLVLGEVVGLTFWIGAVCILIGVLLALMYP